MKSMGATVPTNGLKGTGHCDAAKTVTSECPRCAERDALTPEGRALAVAVENLLDSFRKRVQEPAASRSDLLKLSRAAKMVGRTTKTLKNWMRDGLIKPHRIKGCLYVNAQEFQALISKTDGKRRRSQLRVA